MKYKYYNDITRFFDKHNPKNGNHYMYYDEEDIERKELPIQTSGVTVGQVILNNSNKIFAVYVDTNLKIKYTFEFEKAVSDTYMDMPYDFSKDGKVKSR